MVGIRFWLSIALLHLTLLPPASADGYESTTMGDWNRGRETWKLKPHTSSKNDVYRRRQIWTCKVDHNKTFNDDDGDRKSYSRAKWRVNPAIVNDTSDQFINWIVNNDKNYSRFNMPDDDIPGAIDYRTKKGYVSSVDNLGSCQACWAFAVAGSVEALMAKKEKVFRKLSAQQILDCTGSGNDCSGGSLFSAMAYAKRAGLMADCDYGYEAEKLDCRTEPEKVAYRFQDFLGFKYLNEKMIKYYIATIGPGVTTLGISQSFKDYRGGIFSAETGDIDPTLRHAVLIVGYGAWEGRDYWIIKNSDGVDWGERGYMFLERNTGMCGIGMFSFWPGA